MSKTAIDFFYVMDDRYLTKGGNYAVGDVVVGYRPGQLSGQSHWFFQITSLTKSGTPRLRKLKRVNSNVREAPMSIWCTVKPLAEFEDDFMMAEDRNGERINAERSARYRPSYKAYFLGELLLCKYDASKKYENSRYY